MSRFSAAVSAWVAGSAPRGIIGDRIAAEPPRFRLTDDQVAFFHREGYLSIPQLTTANEVAWIQEIYDRLFDDQRGWEEGNFFDFIGTDEPDKPLKMPQLLQPSKYEPALATTLLRQNATVVARQLLSPKAKMLFDHALLKPALTGPATPWHQDEAFRAVGTIKKSLTVWIPLQDVDVDSGCMQFVPRSHLHQMLPHRSLNDDPRVHALESIDPDLSNAVACSLAAGGATVHLDGTLHGTGPNSSSIPRRAYAMVFGVRSAEVLREEYPWNAGKRTPRHDRYVTSRTPIKRLHDRVKSLRVSLERSSRGLF